MIKHVIFDFDGTIADSLELSVKILNELANKFKYNKVKEEDYNSLRNMTVKERCKSVNLPLYKLPLLGLALISKYRKSIHSLKPFPGIKEVIAELRERGMQLSIISSNSNDNVREFLKNNHINFFDNIYCISSIFGKEKAMHNFIRQFGLNHEDLIYIGDEHRDVVACRINKLKVIAVLWGLDSLEFLSSANPDFIAGKPADILDIIMAL